jgi:hypothetical protein
VLHRRWKDRTVLVLFLLGERQSDERIIGFNTHVYEIDAIPNEHPARHTISRRRIPALKWR